MAGQQREVAHREPDNLVQLLQRRLGQGCRDRPTLPQRPGFGPSLDPVPTESSDHHGVAKQGVEEHHRWPSRRDIVRRLIEGADVVVENFRPGVTERLEIDYASVRERKPDLIY